MCRSVPAERKPRARWNVRETGRLFVSLAYRFMICSRVFRSTCWMWGQKQKCDIQGVGGSREIRRGRDRGRQRQKNKMIKRLWTAHVADYFWESSVVRVLLLRFSRESTLVILETEKFPELLSAGWRPREAIGVQSLKSQASQWFPCESKNQRKWDSWSMEAGNKKGLIRTSCCGSVG